jgi:F-type H+-transporting ATPase subunit b
MNPKRFSGSISCFIVLGILAVSTSFFPMRAVAQEAASSKTAAAAPSADDQESGPTEEEQQVDAFRLEGPVVAWTARTFHISVPRTADIYEVINFLIIALAIGVPLFRVLPKFLRHRKEKLRSDIESARKVTEDANARLTAVEVKLSSLDDEIRKFRAEVEAESLQDEARIKASLGDESARIVEAAEQEIGQAAAQARRGLRNFAADLAIDQAARQLNLTAETDRALIAEFATELAAMSGAMTGGQN